MKKREWIILTITGLILMSFKGRTYKSILASFLPPLEGYSATPYWDYKQWSWGYGTRVPGSVNDSSIKPAGTITREQAWIDALDHINKDKEYLTTLLTVQLRSNQWAALLSFSYNLGAGNADNLIPNINKKDNTALEIQWKKYIYAGGLPNSSLIERRNKEWQLWIGA